MSCRHERGIGGNFTTDDALRAFRVEEPAMKVFPDDFNEKMIKPLRDDLALDNIRPLIVAQVRAEALDGKRESTIDVSKLSPEATRRLANELCQRFGFVFMWKDFEDCGWVRLSAMEQNYIKTDKLRVLY